MVYYYLDCIKDIINRAFSDRVIWKWYEQQQKSKIIRLSVDGNIINAMEIYLEPQEQKQVIVHNSLMRTLTILQNHIGTLGQDFVQSFRICRLK